MPLVEFYSYCTRLKVTIFLHFDTEIRPKYRPITNSCEGVTAEQPAVDSTDDKMAP
jgi:hypothetical protein